VERGEEAREAVRWGRGRVRGLGVQEPLQHGDTGCSTDGEFEI